MRINASFLNAFGTQHMLDELISVLVGVANFFVFKRLVTDSRSVWEFVFKNVFIVLKNIRSIANIIAHMNERALSE